MELARERRQVSTAQSEYADVAMHRHIQLERMMKLSLWGNKADGRNKVIKDSLSGDGVSLEAHDDHLLVDHSTRVIGFLERQLRKHNESMAIQFINDNAGTELLLDLALADHLLTNKWCDVITFSVKHEPMYVSDATPQDVDDHIDALQHPSRSPSIQELGCRLATHVETNQFIVKSDLFWNQYRYYWEMPLELQTRFATEATLVVIKGDLNYRRLLGDRIWPPTTPMDGVVCYFPTSFVALRTLKSDPVIGIPPNVVEKLDAEDPTWRVNGVRGIIQSVLKDE